SPSRAARYACGVCDWPGNWLHVAWCRFRYERVVVFLTSYSLTCSCLPLGIRLYGGRPKRGRGRGSCRTIGGSGEGKILHHTFVVGCADNGGFAQRALPFAVLALKQVTRSLFAAQDL